MDQIYYINKIKEIFIEEYENYKHSSFKEFLTLNKEIILETCEVNFNAGIELLSALCLKIPANCPLQQKLIKLIREYLNEQDK